MVENAAEGVRTNLNVNPADIFLTEHKATPKRGMDNAPPKRGDGSVAEDAVMHALDKQLEGTTSECEQEQLRSTLKSDIRLEAFERQHDLIDLQCKAGDDDGRTVASSTRTKHYELELPMLEFPLTIDIKDIPDPETNSEMSINAPSVHGSVQSSIERNKSVAGRNSSLTREEEERIEILLQEDEGDEERFGTMSTIEEERESELDGILLGLGYVIDDDSDVHVTLEGKEVTDVPTKGDPVLRELAKQRDFEEHERRIDEAIRALMREPLPEVVRFPDEDTEGFTDANNISGLTSLCGDSLTAQTMLTAPVSEHEIQKLIIEVKKELEDEGLELSDSASVHTLAKAIMGEEYSKKTGISIA
ncbi:hypothetical protein ACHAWF_018808 [Thalassiosira exigua]